MRKRLVQAGVAGLFTLWLGSAAAHGLHMTTAEVVQRQDNHLTVTLHTALLELFNRLQYADKPDTPVHMADAPEPQIERFRQALLQLMRDKLQLAVTQRPLQSLNVRVPPAQTLRKLFQHEVAEQVLNAQHGHDHSHNDRRYYLRIDIDGFVDAIEGPRVLEARFPPELGRILVSYSRPQMQTITPAADGSRYRQPLD